MFYALTCSVYLIYFLKKFMLPIDQSNFYIGLLSLLFLFFDLVKRHLIPKHLFLIWWTDGKVSVKKVMQNSYANYLDFLESLPQL